MDRTRKEKGKKNADSIPLVATQNTNLFSQLSAQYMQSKTHINDHEKNFIDNTEVIEYHDQEINRILQKLRKKDEITKVKAMFELKEKVMGMTEEEVEGFASTFCYLFRSLVLNEDSKKVHTELNLILQSLLSHHKKLLLPNIAILFPALLVFQKVNRSNLMGLLFTGDEKSQKEKALKLLLKPEVSKQFLIVSRIIIDEHEKEKLAESLVQNNCYGLVRAFKDLVVSRGEEATETEEAMVELYEEFKRLVVSPGASDFLKENTKAKAALLQIYTSYVENASKSGKLTKNDELMLRKVMENFLEKDQIIQSSLWRHCNVRVLASLVRLNDQQGIQELEAKLLTVMEVGGEEMFRNLKDFIEVLPSYKFTLSDPTSFLNTFLGIKKLNEKLLTLQEYNEARLKAYEEINTHFLALYKEASMQLSELKVEDKLQKRWDECKRALEKAERTVIENLQEFYYKNPPTSKMSPSYYIPPVFSALAKRVEVLPRLNFNPPLTYHLYSQVAKLPKYQSLVDQMFNSRKSLEDLLQYFQNFPPRPINIELEGGDLPETYKKCRIYQLTIEYQQPQWFKWNTHCNFFMFDPTLEAKHIAQIEDNQDVFFNLKLDIPKMDNYITEKFRFVERLLEEHQPEVKYFIPSYRRYLFKFQDKSALESLLRIYTQSRDKLTTPNANIIHSVELISQTLLQYSKVSRQHFDLPDIFDFVLYLFDYNMDTQAYNLLDRCIQLKDNVGHFQRILHSIHNNILQRILKYVDSGEMVEEKKERLLKKKVDRFILLTNKTLHLLVFINRRQEILTLARELLHQEYFKYALYRPEIWILFHSIATQLTASEVRSLVEGLMDGGSYDVLGLLVCVNSLYPLQTHLEMKRFYQQLYISEISPRVIDLIETNDQKGYQLISSMLELCSKSLIFATGIKNIVKQSILEDIPEANIEKLYKITVDRLFEQIQDAGHETMRESVTLQGILPEFSRFIKTHKELFTESLTKLQELKLATKEERTTFYAYLDVVSIFWKQSIDTHLLFQIDLKSIIDKLFGSLNDSYINVNYDIQVALNFMNVVIENKTLEPFSDHLLSIESHVNRLIEYNMSKSPEFLTNALTKLCEFLRKILSIIEAFSPDFGSHIFRRVLDLCDAKVRQFEQVAEDIDAGVVDENIDNVIVEFSEVINRFALVPDIPVNEAQLLHLLASRFAPLQKSCFLYLRHLYENNRGDHKVALRLLDRVIKTGSPKETSDAFSLILQWILVFIRKSTLASESEDVEEFHLLFEKLQASSIYLNLLFRLIDNLGYDETEESFYIQPEEVSQVVLNWSNYMSEKELFRLAIESLFLFSINFPMDLRLWYDREKDKQRQELCQRILKNMISDALFLKEIEKIELRQSQWKSEEFDVYALKKAREICAEYSKNNAKISLKLKIKDNYPLSPVVIQSGNQLKIEQKLQRWILRLKSLLYNQNNSICSGVILWKQNIDKEFQGLEECAICYDIVNNQKQLPKMVCKTCKKKFHSACIRKWFQTSNKSECPLCKSQFL